jgi:hypothetical protein
MQFATQDKQEALDKLQSMFHTSVISDVRREWDTYTIERLTPDQYYLDSVESQKDMDWYFDHLLKALDRDLLVEVSEKKPKKASKRDSKVL